MEPGDICNICAVVLTVDNRYSSQSVKRCKECSRRLRRRRYAANPDKDTLYNMQLRIDVIRGYGSKCTCCSESTEEFLSIDHIKGKDNTNKEIPRSGTALFLWLRRNNYPKDDFRLLCFNCHMAISHHGYCPHDNGIEQQLKRGRPKIDDSAVLFKQILDTLDEEYEEELLLDAEELEEIEEELKRTENKISDSFIMIFG